MVGISLKIYLREEAPMSLYDLLLRKSSAEFHTDQGKEADRRPRVFDLLRIPLPQFEREGSPTEIKVTWFSKTLWFVPTANDATALVKEGVSRGRIWTAKELMDFLSVPNLPVEQAKTIALAKLEFGGEVVAVRFSSRSSGKDNKPVK